MESRVPVNTRRELERRGHICEVDNNAGLVGGDSEVVISMHEGRRSCGYAATVVRRCDGGRAEGAVVSETARNIAGREPVSTARYKTVTDLEGLSWFPLSLPTLWPSRR